MMGKNILKESFEMDRKQMCVRTKQISPGVYKTISRGFIRALSGHYRVPVGTILIPDMDSMIVRGMYTGAVILSIVGGSDGCCLPAPLSESMNC